MKSNPESMSFSSKPDQTPSHNKIETNSLESTREIELSQNLDQTINNQEFKQALFKELKENPALQSKLGLPENSNDIQILQNLESATKDLSANSNHVLKVVELIAVIQKDPRKLMSVPGKFLNVVNQNSQFMTEFDNFLKKHTESSNILKKTAAYLGRTSLWANPIFTSTKTISYLSNALGLISEDEQLQAQLNAENSTDQPELKAWILLQTLKHNESFRHDLYEYATDQYETYQQSKKAA